MRNDAHDIVRRPLITEKGTDISSDKNGYTFLVAPHANKVQIKQAIEELFEVEVLRVNTMTRHGKIKGRGPRAVKRPDWKRAIVTLADGQTVEFL
ncbi:MAG: large subunit ribosomal protein L23 [Pseudohongiellaceae bacterium]|jgi:large subunit ribosomal protein L23